MHFFKVKLHQERENGHGRSSGLIPLPRPSRFQWHKMGRGLRISRRRVRSRFTRDSLFKPFRVAPPVRLPLSEGTLGAARGPVNAAGQIHLTPAFKASYLPGLSVKTSLFDVGGVIRRFLPLTYLSTALLLMPVRLARLANGHGPLGRLPVGFRAKAPFSLPAPKNLASAVATKEATDEDSNWLRKIISKEIAVAIRSGAVLIRNTASP